MIKNSIVQYHDTAEADALLNCLGDINYEAKRDLFNRRQRDCDAFEAVSAVTEPSPGYNFLKDRIECMYYLDNNKAAQWAGLSHVFYIHGAPVIL